MNKIFTNIININFIKFSIKKDFLLLLSINIKKSQLNLTKTSRTNLSKKKKHEKIKKLL